MFEEHTSFRCIGWWTRGFRVKSVGIQVERGRRMSWHGWTVTSGTYRARIAVRALNNP